MRGGLWALIGAVVVSGLAAGDASATTCTTPPVVSVRTGQATKIALNCGAGYAQATITHQPGHGTLVIGAFGAPFTYTPDAGYRGPDSFSYYADAGSAATRSDEVTQAISVSGDGNGAPTCTSSTQTPTLRVSQTRTFFLSCTDPEHDPLTATITAQPAHGTLGTVSNGPNGLIVAYTAISPGDDAFSYRASDGTDQSRVATIQVHDIPVGANTPPTCASDTSISVGSGDIWALVGLCSDPEGDPLTYRLVDAPSHGTFTPLGASATYKPDAGATGTDQFTFVANDGYVDSAVASVDVTLTGPSAPDCEQHGIPGPQTAYHDVPALIRVSCAPGSAGFPIDFVIDTPPAHASAFSGERANDFTWSYTYTAASGYAGPDSFTWHGVGPDGRASAQQITSIVVSADGNRPPECAGPNTLVVRNDTTISAQITCVEHDPGDDNTLTVLTQPAHGHVQVDDSNDSFIDLTYDPDDDYEGLDSFQARVDDGRGGQSAVITVNASVIRADYNRPPSCFATGGFASPGLPHVLDRICHDPDGDPLTYTVTGQPQHGAATIGSDGQIVYRSVAGYSGADTLVFQVADDHGASVTGHFALQVGTGTPPPLPGGDGSGGGGSTAPRSDPAVTNATPPGGSTGPAGRPTTSATQADSPRSDQSVAATPTSYAVVPGLHLKGVTASLTGASPHGVVNATRNRSYTVMTLVCSSACTITTQPQFAIPATKSATGKRTAAHTVNGTLKRIQLTPGKYGAVALRIPASVRAKLAKIHSIRVRFAVKVWPKGGTPTRGITAFTVRI